MMNTTFPASLNQPVLPPFGMVLMEGAQELLGKEDLERILELLPKQSGERLLTFETSSAFSAQLENYFGKLSGRGLALRVGRYTFKYLLQTFGEVTGLSSVEFKLLPAPRRISCGLGLLASVIDEQFNDHITIREEEDYWLWQSKNCPVCAGRASEDSSCYLMVGLLQEFLSWASGGRSFNVREVECRAAGGEFCTYHLDKRPID